MKKLGTLFNELETISEDLLKQENKVYLLVIYFAKIVEQNYIIVLQLNLHQIGNFTDVPFYDSSKIEVVITEKNIQWKDYEHYSSRQKKAMQLGGVTGTFKLKGIFSEFDLALLDFARICNAGKNPNFGLGQIDYWER